MEKVNCYDNLEERVIQMASIMQLMQNHSLEASQIYNFNVLRMYLVFKFVIIATIILLLKMISL